MVAGVIMKEGMKRFLTMVAVCVLLFVVVCPITPTPIAVPGGKAQAAQAPAIAVVAIALVLPERSEHPLWTSTFELPGAMSIDVLDLTCARLC